MADIEMESISQEMDNVVAKESSSSRDSDGNQEVVGINDLSNDLRIYGSKFIIFSCLFYICIPIFYFWINLRWSFIDSIYFCVVTFATVGFGDIVPTTPAQRTITSFFILIGICVAGNLIGVISAILTERHKRMTFQIQKLETQNEMEAAKSLKRRISSVSDHPTLKIASSYAENIRRKFDEITSINDYFSRSSLTDRDYSDRTNIVAQMRFKYLQRLQDMRWEIFLNMVYMWLTLLVGMGVMMSFEGWSSDVAFYWAIVTISTVGYGDFVPTTDGAKLFTVFYIIVGAYFLFNCFSSLVWTPIKILSLKNEIRVIKQFENNFTEKQFNSIVANPLFSTVPRLRKVEGSLTKCEFVLTFLNLLNKVQDHDITVAASIFDKLDQTASGELTSQDVNRYKHEARARDIKRIRSLSSNNMEGGDAEDSYADTTNILHQHAVDSGTTTTDTEGSMSML